MLRRRHNNCCGTSNEKILVRCVLVWVTCKQDPQPGSPLEDGYAGRLDVVLPRIILSKIGDLDPLPRREMDVQLSSTIGNDHAGERGVLGGQPREWKDKNCEDSDEGFHRWNIQGKTHAIVERDESGLQNKRGLVPWRGDGEGPVSALLLGAKDHASFVIDLAPFSRKLVLQLRGPSAGYAPPSGRHTFPARHMTICSGSSKISA